MNGEAKPHEAETFEEQISWWHEAIQSLPDVKETEDPQSHQAVAEQITGAMGNHNFDEWYQDGSGDQWFVEAFNLASTLELPSGFNIPDEDRPQAWHRLKALTSALKEKYVEGTENADQFLEETKSFSEILDSYHKQ